MQNIWGHPQSHIDKCDLGSDVSPHWDSADMLSESCPFAFCSPLSCMLMVWSCTGKPQIQSCRSLQAICNQCSHCLLPLSTCEWLTRRKGDEPDWLGLYMIIMLNAGSLNSFCCQLCSCFILPHSYRVLTFGFLTVVSYVITFTSLFSFSRLHLIYKKVFRLSSGFLLQWILI